MEKTCSQYLHVVRKPKGLGSALWHNEHEVQVVGLALAQQLVKRG